MGKLLVFVVLAVGQLPVHQSVPYRWERHDPEGSQVNLYLGKRQVGAFDIGRGVYMPLLDFAANRWGDPCPPPVRVPDDYLPPQARGKLMESAGVQLELLPAGETVLHAGEECAKSCLLRSLEDKMPDDTTLPYLVIVGSPDKRKKVIDDVTAANKEGPDKVHFRLWEVAASHWSLGESDGGPPIYKAAADPTVYLVAADGRELHRQEGWNGPADFDAIRKARKPYDPAKSVDLRKLAPWNWFPKIDPLTVVGVGAGLVLLLKKGQGEA